MSAEKPKKHPAVRYGKKLLRRLDRAIEASSIEGTGPFFDASRFPWIGGIEREWRVIRAELDRVLETRERIPHFHDISPDQYRISHDGEWRTFFLYGYGYEAEENCRRCPETARLLRTIPGMRSGFFSILGAGKRIPAHRGAWKGLLRYHLGLLVPDPPDACGIRVGGEQAHWEEGRSLVFDDTFRHEAWNETGRDRVVLFVDFDRPLRAPAKHWNRLAIELIRRSPFVQRGIENFKNFQR
jgi:ornithine lipid ester-linked acyl 2-hydroxylase